MAQAELQTEDPDAQSALNKLPQRQRCAAGVRAAAHAVAEDDPDAAAEARVCAGQIAQYQAQANDAWDYLKQHEPQLTEIIASRG